MSIRVKVFASLAERTGLREATCAYRAGMTVARVWQDVSKGEVFPPNALSAVNFEYAKPETPVNDGDEVGFFPPVTGG
jgi:molybdopterin synthase sulfur carrier subunit